MGNDASTWGLSGQIRTPPLREFDIPTLWLSRPRWDNPNRPPKMMSLRQARSKPLLDIFAHHPLTQLLIRRHASTQPAGKPCQHSRSLLTSTGREGPPMVNFPQQQQGHPTLTSLRFCGLQITMCPDPNSQTSIHLSHDHLWSTYWNRKPLLTLNPPPPRFPIHTLTGTTVPTTQASLLLQHQRRVEGFLGH